MKGDKLIVSVIVGVFLVLYTVIVYSFMGAESGESRQTYMLLLAVPLALVVIKYPKIALFIIALLIYVMRWMYDTLHLLPREITYVADILIVIMFLRAFPRILKREGRQRIVLLTLGLMAFALLSGLLNSVGIKSMIAGTRMAFHFVLLFVAAQYLNLSKGQIRAFLIMLFVIGLAQTPITLYQFKVQRLFMDDVSGTFGLSQTPSIALYILVLLSYLGARMIETGRMRAIFLAATVWMTVCPILGSAKFYFLILPFFLLYMYRAELFRRPGVSIAMLLTAAVLFFAGDRLAASAGGWYEDFRPVKLLTRIPEFFQHDLQVAEYGRFDRGYQLISAVRLAAESPRRVIIGYGPGSATQSHYADAATVEMFASRFGLISSVTMPALWLLLEYGYVGLALFFCMFWMIYRRAKVLRASEDVDMRIYGRMLQNIVFLYVIWMFYQQAWQSDAMAYIFWAPAGILVGLSYAEERRQRIAAERTSENPLAEAPAAVSA